MLRPMIMAEGGKRRKLENGNYEAVASETSPEVHALEKKDQRRSLFVRSLPASVTSERLAEYFSQSYPLKHATVVSDPQTKVSRGFGFVTFADADDAQAAASDFNNATLDGRKIKVEVAESRQRDAIQEGRRGGPNVKAVELRAQRETEKKETQPPRLIVRNLPWSIKEPGELAALFQSYGKVKHAIVPKRSPRVQAGFGIVLIRGIKNAEKALAGLNGKEVDGRVIAVDWAADKATWQKMQKGAHRENGEEKADTPDEGFSPDAENDESEVFDRRLQDQTMDKPIEDMGMIDEEDEIGSEGEPEEDDMDMEDEDEMQDEQDDTSSKTTIFVRNLPFTADDDILQSHFSTFGPIRYARVVFDPSTERSRGTAFVCFFNEEDAKSCVKGAPKHDQPSITTNTDKKRRGETMTHSILQNEGNDPSGKYTLEGRVLQISRALSKSDAARREEEASSKRDVRDRDKRRLYLLSEGTISNGSKLYEQLGKAELDVRESSAKQRQKLIRTNPNLCLSLTRLSVRNVPRSVGSKELKALAREAVVEFATDVKNGVRQRLSREELMRGGQAMKDAEYQRKSKGVGIVKQATVVFEGREGEKVKEGGGGGRSRGYGFVEYISHRNALMGLRWLNGRSVKGGGGGDRNKRLIVEFAIENAQVVQRRSEREIKERSQRAQSGESAPSPQLRKYSRPARHSKFNVKTPGTEESKKRKRDEKSSKPTSAKGKPAPTEAGAPDEKNKVAKRNRIIAKKRNARKARKSR